MTTIRKNCAHCGRRTSHRRWKNEIRTELRRQDRRTPLFLFQCNNCGRLHSTRRWRHALSSRTLCTTSKPPVVN